MKRSRNSTRDWSEAVFVSPRTRRGAALFCLVALVLAGCAAGRGAYKRGLDAELARNFDEALMNYEQALAEKPGDIEYRLKVEQARFAAAFQHFENGRRALEAGDLQAARAEFLRARQLDPTHEMARAELERVEAMIRTGLPPQAETRPDFEVRQERALVDPSPDLQLSPTITGPITLRMTQQTDVIFETLGQLTGLNIISDPDLPSEQLSVNLDGVTIYDALDTLALQSRAFWKPINQNTVIIAPENQQKRRDYESHILKTIYLTNSVNPADITEAITAIRTLLNMRFIAQSTSMNAIIVRDTPDKVAIAEKIIRDIDKSKPEVLVEATVLEVDRNRLRELGILPPTGTAVGLDPNVIPGGEDEEFDNSVNIRDLDGLNSGSFNIVIPDSLARFLETDSRTRLLQNPTVRASDGMLASIRIGSRVPVASGSFQPAFVGATGTPVVQFQYIDVGVNMDITPRVLLNREVSMQVVVQVQATAGSNQIGGVELPVFTNRSITHEIRLQEGETNILGGLITETESSSFSGLPLLNQVPLLNRLFSSETRRRDQTEIIILLTPHIVKMPDITDRNLRGLMVGTETDTRLRGPAIDPELGPLGALAPPLLPVEAGTPAPPVVSAESDFPAVRFDSALVQLAPGGLTNLEVQIDAENMAGADLTIEFDPSRVALPAIADGGFLSQDGIPVTVVENVDASRGQARVSLDRQDGAGVVSGSGTVLSLTLEAIGEGESLLRISDFSLREAGGASRSGELAQTRLSTGGD